MNENLDAVIVGGGLAGLSAARVLAAAGKRFVLLEARDRVGGRTFSKQIGKATFDVGGQWLGADQPRLASLVRELSVKTFPTFHEGKKVLELHGKHSTYSGTIPKLAPWRLLDLEIAIRKMEAIARKTVVSDPRRTPGSLRLDSLTLEAWMARETFSQAARDLVTVAIRVVFGAEPRELSMLHLAAYARAGGGLMKLVEIAGGAQETRFVLGAQEVSNQAAARLGERVVLSSPVRAIEQTDDGVIVRGDGKAWSAHRVIVAVPPALAARIDFPRPLPVLRDQLLQRFPMGATVKVLALYERAFWRERGMSGEAVFFPGPPSVVFDNTSHDGAQPCLLGFVVGEQAREWSSRTPAARRDETLSALARAFGPEAARPTDFVEQDWSTEPWSGGCPVGYLAPGVLTTFASALRAPCGRVHWAGTETAVEWTGYMEGALESGERAAREVIGAD